MTFFLCVSSLKETNPTTIKITLVNTILVQPSGKQAQANCVVQFAVLFRICLLKTMRTKHCNTVDKKIAEVQSYRRQVVEGFTECTLRGLRGAS